MRVRITRPPTGAVDGISLHTYRPGRAYDVPTSLATYLVAEGLARVEMRERVRSERKRERDRRHPSRPG